MANRTPGRKSRTSRHAQISSSPLLAQAQRKTGAARDSISPVKSLKKTKNVEHALIQHPEEKGTAKPRKKSRKSAEECNRLMSV